MALQMEELSSKSTKMAKSRRSDLIVMRLNKQLDEFKELSMPVLQEVRKRFWKAVT